LLAKNEIFQDHVGPGMQRGKSRSKNFHRERQDSVTLAQFGGRVTLESVRAFG
jgi:hypothetical protein